MDSSSTTPYSIGPGTLSTGNVCATHDGFAMCDEMMMISQADLYQMCLAAVTVGANVRSYVLTDLDSETDYSVHIMASTVAGSKNGSDYNFKTTKFGMSCIFNIS